MSTMNLPYLPSEIVILIAEFLGDDWHSMLNFYKANKSTRHALSSRLYRSVHLKSSKSIKSLCQVSTTFRYVELRNIRSLQIGLSSCTYSASFRLPNDLVSSFRSALKQMPDLLSLSLPTVPSVLDTLLEGFDPPFHLTELIHSGKLSSELAGFLQKQPSIVRLGWYSLLLDEQPAHLSKLLENELFLPALNELAGPLPLLSVVIPRRSITKIKVMYHTLAFLRLEGSMAAFSYPIGRLSSLCIVEHRPSWQGCMTLICNLKATYTRHTLKDIHIVEAFVGPSALRQQNAFRAHVARLVGFDSLEYVKISQASGTKLQARAVYEQLRTSGMDQISSWRMIIPSLVSVDVYNYKVPQ